jgi:hypothetical protein
MRQTSTWIVIGIILTGVTQGAPLMRELDELETSHLKKSPMFSLLRCAEMMADFS